MDDESDLLELSESELAAHVTAAYLRGVEKGRAEGRAQLKALSECNGSTEAVLGWIRKANGWSEELHPRDHGKFSEKPGGAAGKKVPTADEVAAAREKAEKVADRRDRHTTEALQHLEGHAEAGEKIREAVAAIKKYHDEGHAPPSGLLQRLHRAIQDEHIEYVNRGGRSHPVLGAAQDAAILAMEYDKKADAHLARAERMAAAASRPEREAKRAEREKAKAEREKTRAERKKNRAEAQKHLDTLRDAADELPVDTDAPPEVGALNDALADIPAAGAPSAAAVKTVQGAAAKVVSRLQGNPDHEDAVAAAKSIAAAATKLLARNVLKGQWDESKHARDHGKFASKPGSHPLTAEQRDALRELHRHFPQGIAHLLNEHGAVHPEHLESDEDRGHRAAIAAHTVGYHRAASDVAGHDIRNGMADAELDWDIAFNNSLNKLPFAAEFDGVGEPDSPAADALWQVYDALDTIEQSEFPDHPIRPDADNMPDLPDAEVDHPDELEDKAAEFDEARTEAADLAETFVDESRTFREEAAEVTSAFREEQAANLHALKAACHSALALDAAEWEGAEDAKAKVESLSRTVDGLLAQLTARKPVEKAFSEDKVKRDHGKFAKQEGSNGVPEARVRSGAAATPADAAEGKIQSLASRIKEVPAGLARRVSEWVQGRYAKLAARYGDTGAKAVLAGMVALAPVPVPGSSLIPIALAEAVRGIHSAGRAAGVWKAVAHAPPGGVSIRGKDFRGGEFIPADVMARATDAERAKVQGGDSIKPRRAEKVSPHAAAIAKARAKFAAAPKPTRAEVSANRAGMKKLGANKFRRNLVGNSTDRAKRRKALLAEFGNGKTCPCVYCGVKIGEGTLEQDKLYTTAEGGRYRLPNLVPCCGACNKHRLDKPFAEFADTIQARKAGTPEPTTTRHAPPEPTPEMHTLAQQWAGASDIPDETRAEYAGHMAHALAGLPDAVRSEVMKTMGLRKFAPTFHADGAALNARASKLSGRKQSGILGFVHERGGTVVGLHLNGGEDPTGTYVHEMWHVADDGYHSQTPAWKSAWKSELKNPRANNILSGYAATNEAEGLAEFGRFVAEQGHDEARRRYPKCYAALVKQRLLT